MKKLRNLLLLSSIALGSLPVLAQSTVPTVDLSEADAYGTAVKTAVTGFATGTYLQVLGAIAVAFLAVRFVLLIVHRAGRTR